MFHYETKNSTRPNIVRSVTIALVGGCLYRNSVVYTNPKLAVALPVILICTSKLYQTCFSEMQQGVITQKPHSKSGLFNFSLCGVGKFGNIWSP